MYLTVFRTTINRLSARKMPKQDRKTAIFHLKKHKNTVHNTPQSALQTLVYEIAM